MRLTKYEKSLLNEDVYWFVSSGKHGDIYKAVLFQPLPETDRFNLALGDINLQTGELEFDQLTGNGDARKVFATIGDIIDEYTSFHPERSIFISGNTDDKRRSYSFMTSWYFDEIKILFDIWGAFEGDEFESFQKNKEYYSILIKRK